MISKVWVELPDEPIRVGDFCVTSSRSVVCRVTQVFDSPAVWGGPPFAVFEPVKADGTRNRNWRGWSGNLDGYVRVIRRDAT
jgi:hypothetical protein